MFRSLKPIVLASGSPRRRELLQGLGLDFAIHPAQGPEPGFPPGFDPAEYALLTAAAKAREAAAGNPDAAILAADTIVVVDGDVLGKPGDEAEALAMLARLAGREHQVITGCCLLIPMNRGPASKSPGSKGKDMAEYRYAVRARVWMADFGPEALAAYAATSEPLDKAGAYGIQERAAFLVERIEGSYTTVVGLPLTETVRLLLDHGVISPQGPFMSRPRQPRPG